MLHLPGHPYHTPWEPGEEGPCLETELSPPPDRRKRQGPKSHPFPSTLQAVSCGAEGLPYPLLLCCSKQVFPSSHLFCLPRAPFAWKAAWASSRAAAPRREDWLAAQRAPSRLPAAATTGEAAAKLPSLSLSVSTGDLELPGPHCAGRALTVCLCR